MACNTTILVVFQITREFGLVGKLELINILVQIQYGGGMQDCLLLLSLFNPHHTNIPTSFYRKRPKWLSSLDTLCTAVEVRQIVADR